MSKKNLEDIEPEPNEPIDIDDLPEPPEPTPPPKPSKDDNSLHFERLEDICKRLESIDLSPSDLPETPEKKSKSGLIIFVLVFALGIVGYFLFKNPAKEG